MKIRMLMWALVSLGMLAGCASPSKMLPDGRMLVATNVGDGLSRDGTYFQILDKGKNEDGTEKLTEVAGQLSIGPTFAGQALIGITQGIGAAYIQGEAARSVAKTKAGAQKCPPGVVNCHSTVLEGGSAMADANSGSFSDAAIKAVINSGCPSGNCVVVSGE